MIESRPSSDSSRRKQTTVTNTFAAITEIVFCMMFEEELSLRIISFFGDEHWRGISAQNTNKKKIKEEEKPCERIFQSCCSGLIFKKKKNCTHAQI